MIYNYHIILKIILKLYEIYELRNNFEISKLSKNGKTFFFIHDMSMLKNIEKLVAV